MSIASKDRGMIRGGNATIFVSDMDRAVKFYSETLGLSLKKRFGNDWAEIDCGGGMTIGLHPQGTNPQSPRPGVNGSTQVGLLVTQPLELVVETLTQRNVKFEGPIIDDDDAVRLAFLFDPDGNLIYLFQVTW